MMHKGFSLVELSIVLVILGLLTGGILAGQSLIRAAELRSVITEHDRYAAAIHTFRDKYFAAPGDFRDATKFWGLSTVSGNCTSNSGAAVTSPGVCDGNGDGTLNIATVVYNPNQANESFQIWRHLALAGLIEGGYSGMDEIGGYRSTATNAPRAKVGGYWWLTGDYQTLSGPGNLWTGVNYGNSMLIWNPMMPEELWNLDTKLDDGKPGSGILISGPTNAWSAGWGGPTACHRNGPAVTAANNVYNLTTTHKSCTPWFIQAL